MDVKIVFALLSISSRVFCLDNGLALKPPMGWLAWTRFMCETDCIKKPKDCISEQLFIDMAEMIVKRGYRDAGYIHVNIDDCWMSRQRDRHGRLVPDPKRFSHGIKWLAEYMHNRGLKLGIYQNYGKYTCMGYPGSLDHMKIDAETFASWDADYLKFDGCFNDPTTLDTAYPEMGKYLNETKRPMIYSCSWPYYVRKELKKTPNYSSIVKHCNLWRNYEDIQISWASIEFIIDFYDKNQDEFAKYHGPDHWNDPDMIIIGNPGLTVDQCRAQMAVWAIWSAPLLMSNDLRDMKPEFQEILLNRKVIAINQDQLGIMGKMIKKIGPVSVYKKQISSRGPDFAFAFAFLNRDYVQMKYMQVSLDMFDLRFKNGYRIENLFTDEVFESVTASETVAINVPPMGVIMWKVTPNEFAAPVEEQKQKIDDRETIAELERSVGHKKLIYGDREESDSFFFWLWIYCFVFIVIIYFALKRCLPRHMFRRTRLRLA